jgi:hypothetical protein
MILTINWPEPSQNAEQTALAATIGSLDNQTLSPFDAEAQRFDQDITIGTDDGYVLEDDVIGFLDCPSTKENCLIKS